MRSHIIIFASLSLLVVGALLSFFPAGTSSVMRGKLNAIQRVEQTATVIRWLVSVNGFQQLNEQRIYAELDDLGIKHSRECIGVRSFETCSNLLCVSCAYLCGSTTYFMEKLILVGESQCIWESGVWCREGVESQAPCVLDGLPPWDVRQDKLCSE